MASDLLRQIEEITEVEVRPVLKADGGDVRILELTDNVRYVSVLGKCSSCPNAQSEVTLLMENAMKKHNITDIQVGVDIEINHSLNELAKRILRKEIKLSKN